VAPAKRTRLQSAPPLSIGHYRAAIDYWYEKDEGYKQRGPIADTAGSQVRCYIRSRRAQRTACLKKKKKGKGKSVGRFLPGLLFSWMFPFSFFLNAPRWG
jgi:hypothetical protein